MYQIPENFDCGDCGDATEFHRLLYDLQNSKKVTIIKIFVHKYPLNYYKAEIEYEFERIILLKNCCNDLMAFSSIDIKEDKLLFVDNLKLQVFIKKYYPSAEFLTTKELNMNITNDNLSYISELDKKDISNWLPCTIGEIIFSWYFD